MWPGVKSGLQRHLTTACVKTAHTNSKGGHKTISGERSRSQCVQNKSTWQNDCDYKKQGCQESLKPEMKKNYIWCHLDPCGVFKFTQIL